MKKLLCIFFLFVLGKSCYLEAQNDSLYFEPQYRHGIKYTLKTTVGTVYTGFVVDETKDYVTLEDRLTRDRFELKKSEIIVSERRHDIKTHVPWGENNHAGNYMLANSAFLFEQGKASTNSHWLLLESINYAFSDNWGICLNTLAFYPVTLGVKCAFKVGEDNYLGAYAFGIGDVTSNSNGSLFLGYSAMAKFTKGSDNKNFTISGGLLGLNSDMFYAVAPTPYVNMGFVSGAYCNRFSRNVALNLETWYLPEIAAGLAGLGFKFIGDEYTCWTIGCYALMNSYDSGLKLNLKTLPLPYFGVAKKFN